MICIHYSEAVSNYEKSLINAERQGYLRKVPKYMKKQPYERLEVLGIVYFFVDPRFKAHVQGVVVRNRKNKTFWVSALDLEEYAFAFKDFSVEYSGLHVTREGECIYLIKKKKDLTETELNGWYPELQMSIIEARNRLDTIYYPDKELEFTYYNSEEDFIPAIERDKTRACIVPVHKQSELMRLEEIKRLRDCSPNYKKKEFGECGDLCQMLSELRAKHSEEQIEKLKETHNRYLKLQQEGKTFVDTNCSGNFSYSDRKKYWAYQQYQEDKQKEEKVRDEQEARRVKEQELARKAEEQARAEQLKQEKQKAKRRSESGTESGKPTQAKCSKDKSTKKQEQQYGVILLRKVEKGGRIVGAIVENTKKKERRYLDKESLSKLKYDNVTIASNWRITSRVSGQKIPTIKYKEIENYLR